MNSSDLDPHLTHGSLDPHESSLQTASRSVQPFLHSTCVRPAHTDTQTTLRMTSVAMVRICATHAMRPNNRELTEFFVGRSL